MWAWAAVVTQTAVDKMRIFRFESATCFSHHEAWRQLDSAVCDEDLLCLKMHGVAACAEHLRGGGVAGDLAVSDLMGDLIIPEEV